MVQVMVRITSGEFKGRRLSTTSGPGYRPATEKVREAVFSMLESRLSDWSRLVAADIFAGSGSLGFEALSRGARRAYFVEKNARAARQIQNNAELLQLPNDRYRILKRDAFQWVRSRPEEKFGLVFIDPPYKKGLLDPFLNRLLASDWMEENGIILAEVEQDISFSPDSLCSLELVAQRDYGQTRIYLWRTSSRV